MNSKRSKTKIVGERTGYLLMFLIFSTILYFILFFLNKLPSNWTYIHILALTTFIIIIGKSIKFALK